jgi:hypothetical protein
VAKTREALQAVGAELQGAKKGDASTCQCRVCARATSCVSARHITGAIDASGVSAAVAALSEACDVLTPDERQIADAVRAYNEAAKRVGQGACVRE